MNPVTQTHTTTGAKDPIALDYLPTSQITAAVSESGATNPEYDVEVTLDNVVDPDSDDYIAPASARWFVILTEASDPLWTTFDGPWLAIRITINVTGSGTVIFQVGQATTPRA